MTKIEYFFEIYLLHGIGFYAEIAYGNSVFHDNLYQRRGQVYVYFMSVRGDDPYAEHHFFHTFTFRLGNEDGVLLFFAGKEQVCGNAQYFCQLG